MEFLFFFMTSSLHLLGLQLSLSDSSSCLTESNALLKSIANTRTASQSGLFKCLLINCWIANSALVQFPASYPDVSLLMKMCAQRKAGRRQRARRRFAYRLYPSHGPLLTSQLAFRARLELRCEKRA